MLLTSEKIDSLLTESKKGPLLGVLAFHRCDMLRTKKLLPGSGNLKSQGIKPCRTRNCCCCYFSVLLQFDVSLMCFDAFDH